MPCAHVFGRLVSFCKLPLNRDRVQGVSFTATPVQINCVKTVCFSVTAMMTFCILYVSFCSQCNEKLVHTGGRCR